MRKNVVQNQSRVAVVTGASSGIGGAIARRLAQEGFQLALVARRKKRLAQLASELGGEGTDVVVLPTDLADQRECSRVFERASAAFGAVDVLINNAGFGWYGFGDEMSWDKARQMIEVNIASLTLLTLSFLSDMKKRGQGHIINIGSIAGSIPSQGVALYSATKAFVDAFTTSLYRELSGTNVHVTVVRAGAVATDFYEVASDGPASPRIPVGWLAIRPETVADRVWKLVQRPVRVVYVPRVLCVVPWIELGFGWLMDRIGPLLLRHPWKESSGRGPS